MSDNFLFPFSFTNLKRLRPLCHLTLPAFLSSECFLHFPALDTGQQQVLLQNGVLIISLLRMILSQQVQSKIMISFTSVPNSLRTIAVLFKLKIYSTPINCLLSCLLSCHVTVTLICYKYVLIQSTLTSWLNATASTKSCENLRGRNDN